MLSRIISWFIRFEQFGIAAADAEFGRRRLATMKLRLPANSIAVDPILGTQEWAGGEV